MIVLNTMLGIYQTQFISYKFICYVFEQLLLHNFCSQTAYV